MSLSPEAKRLAVAAAGAAALALLAARLRGPAEQIVKRGLVDDPEKVGKLVGVAAANKLLGEEHEYDFIIGGGGNRRISPRLPSIRALRLQSAPPGGWHKWAGCQFYSDPSGIWSNHEVEIRLGFVHCTTAQLQQPFHYGAPTDYDEWSKATNEPEGKEWEFEHFQKSFRKFETFHPHPDFPLDESKRGVDGPIQTGFTGNYSNVARSFVSACETVGIPKNPDFNTARCSAEAAYITPTVLARPNLTVATSAQVTRILFEGKRATGVEFARSKDAPRYQVRARKEIILCAGAVHTPHILMNSGIGPAEELSKHQIPVIQDLPGVGDHLMDHQGVNLRFRTVPGESLNYLNAKKATSFYDKLKRSKAIGQYLLSKSGPLTSNFAEAACFLRSDDPKVFPGLPPLSEDTCSGPGAPDLELIAMPIGFKNHGKEDVADGDLMTILTTVLRPTSKGKIRLRSNDPFDAPIIDPNYLSTQHDVDAIVRGMRLALRLARTEPMQNIIDSTDRTPALDHTLLEADDEALAQVARHTEAPALAIGEKAADIVKAAHPVIDA
ncbi:GMC oxidoreductase [Ceratobasidium sp. AG-Ba]|nr:GMC oxidoreductase [Ceratobasidium sp. AG-Ba]